MSAICPTITAYDIETFRSQLELVSSFAPRIHIDLMDGEFAPTQSPPLHSMWWSKKIQADLHVMYKRPLDILPDVLAKHPHLTIIHDEAEHASSFIHTLHEHRLRVGIALLPHTSVDVLSHYIQVIDHVLIFSGNLGHHGGTADLSLLDKVRWIRLQRPSLEIGWDGGISAENIHELKEAGVTVFNVGGYIHSAESPKHAYENLVSLLQ